MKNNYHVFKKDRRGGFQIYYDVGLCDQQLLYNTSFAYAMMNDARSRTVRRRETQQITYIRRQ